MGNEVGEALPSTTVIYTNRAPPPGKVVRSGRRHPLFTNQAWARRLTAEQRGESRERPAALRPDTRRPDTRRPPRPASQPPEKKPERKKKKMPCRKENYIFLEQSVTVDSKEVDALVTKIGEALQLHNNSAGGQKTMACLHHGVSVVDAAAGLKHAGGGGGVTNVGFAMQQQQRQRGGHGCCMRLRNRSHRGSRASPYGVPGSGDQEWDRIKPWNRKRLAADDDDDDDDPHRLLQQLILSGNLIKEAVRRLQFPAAECGDFSAGSDAVSC